jgi:hypothetical protein
MAGNWSKIIKNEIQNRTGNEGANKIPALKALLMYVEAAEMCDDERIMKLDFDGNNRIVLSIPEVLTSIRINAPGEAFGNG